MSLSSFPPTVHIPVPPSLHRVPWARFPGFRGTTRHSDSLPPLPPHFVAFAWRYRSPRRSFAPSGQATRAARGPGVWSPVPRPADASGDDKASQVPGGSVRTHALLFDPGGPNAPGPMVEPEALILTRPCGLPLLERASTPAKTVGFEAQSHGLRARCLRFAARVAPRPRKTRFRPVGQTLAGWDWLPTGSHERFHSFLRHGSSSPRLRLAHPYSTPQ